MTTTSLRWPEKAFLVVGSPWDGSDKVPLDLESPLHVIQLLGKPVLHHVIEALAQAGVKQITCLGWEATLYTASLLGDGSRWGMTLEWITVGSAQAAWQRMAHLSRSITEPIWVASTCAWFAPPPHPHPNTTWQPTDSCQWLAEHETTPIDYPWMVLAPSDLNQWVQSVTWETWKQYPTPTPTPTPITLHCPAYPLAHGADVLAAQQAVLDKRLPAVLSGYEIEEGIFVSRNVVIHPTAHIQTPVFLAEDVRIEAGCVVGPYVSLGRNAHLGKESELKNALVGNNTWLGEALTLDGHVAARGYLWSRQHQARVPVIDPGLMSASALRWDVQRSVSRWLEWLLVAGLGLLGLPVWVTLWMWSMSIRQVHRLHMVPPRQSHLIDAKLWLTSWFKAHATSTGWQHFLGYVIPNLGLVLRGRLRLTGPRARHPDEWQQLDPEHRRWLAERHCGLIQEATLQRTPHDDDPWQETIMERFQAAQAASIAYNLGLVGRYVKQLL